MEVSSCMTNESFAVDPFELQVPERACPSESLSGHLHHSNPDKFVQAEYIAPEHVLAHTLVCVKRLCV